VNALDTFTDRIDILDALFGTEVFVHSERSDGSVDRRVARKPDGALVNERGPQNTRVSAVLLCERVFPWSVATANVCLYHNPFAAISYESALCALPQMRPVDGQVKFAEGDTLAQVLGLPASWPSDETP
jgi:hypothetical protein